MRPFATELQEALHDTYRLERELPGGGMGHVYLATELTLGRSVVIKTLPGETADEQSAIRFRREIQVAARLQHPLIVPLFSAGQAAGTLYYTMPWVEGESLRARIERGGALPAAEMITILRELLSALATAHEHGIVHRDIKPENIMLSGGHAMLLDFGVARALSGVPGWTGVVTATGTGMVVGTPAYMAPEQVGGDITIDHRADLYAVGLVAYELLLGKSPFAGRTQQAILAAQVTEMPASLSTQRTGIPRELASLVMRLLAKDPRERPASAMEALAELDLVQVSKRSAAATRKRWIALAAVLLLSLLLAGRGLLRRDTDTGPVAIAVAPIHIGTSADSTDADWLGLDLMNAIERIEGIELKGRSSFPDTRRLNLDPIAVGKKLGVSRVLTGNFRRQNGRVFIQLRLMDVATDKTLWVRDSSAMFGTEAYDSLIPNYFAVELKRELIPDRADPRPALGRGTSNPEAYDLVRLGQANVRKRGKDQRGALLEAIRQFEGALDLDTAYMEAAAGLAGAYSVMAIQGYMPQREAVSKTRTAAELALELDSTSVDARVAYGTALTMLGDYARAEENFKEAIRLRPNHAPARQMYSLLMMMQERYDEAWQANARVRELDALWEPGWTVLGCLLMQQGNFAAARDTFDFAIKEIGGGYPLLTYYRGVAELKLSRYQEAVLTLEETVQRAPGYPGAYAMLALAYRETGQPERAENLKQELERMPRDGRRAWNQAFMRAVEGDVDGAYRLVGDISWDIPSVIELRSNPYLDSFRSHVRYRSLLRKIGLIP